jgi:predicted ATPase
MKGEGNPFLTEEIVVALKEAGALNPNKNGEYALPDMNQIKSVPNSLTGVLTSKVDRLSPLQQILLKSASVIGNR